MKMKFLLTALAMVAASNMANATVLTFDIPGSSYNSVPAGYGQLNWSNFDVFNTTGYRRSGYVNGVVSGSGVLFNAYGSPASFSSSQAFTFNSMDMTAAWTNGLNIRVTGSLNGKVVDSEVITVNSNKPTLETFNWSNINAVSFTSYGGSNAGYGWTGEEFVADNLKISPVPEPSTWAMIAGGLCMIGFMQRKRG